MRANRPDAADAAPCRCGCIAELHDHYRPGTDCGRCGNAVCEVYRPVDAPAWREPPMSPAEQVFQEVGARPEGMPDPREVVAENVARARDEQARTHRAAQAVIKQREEAAAASPAETV